MDSLKKALEATGLIRLPNEYDGYGVWIRAVVLIKKADGTKSYGLAEFDGEERTVVRDFGSASQIREIIAIYPYRYLRQAIPSFQSRADTKRYLAISGVPVEYLDEIMEDPVRLRSEIYKAVIRIQLMEDESRKRAFDRLKSYKEYLKRFRKKRRK